MAKTFLTISLLLSFIFLPLNVSLAQSDIPAPSDNAAATEEMAATPGSEQEVPVEAAAEEAGDTEDDPDEITEVTLEGSATAQETSSLEETTEEAVAEEAAPAEPVPPAPAAKQDIAVEAPAADSAAAQDTATAVASEEAGVTKTEMPEAATEEPTPAQGAPAEAATDKTMAAEDTAAEAQAKEAVTPQETATDTAAGETVAAEDTAAEAQAEDAVMPQETAAPTAADETVATEETAPEAQAEEAAIPEEAPAEAAVESPYEYEYQFDKGVIVHDRRLSTIDNALSDATEERASDIRKKPYNTGLPSPDDTPPAAELPGWVKRMWFGSIIQTDQEPRLYFETVQPLYQSADDANTVFTQGRASFSNGNQDYSLGVGYRRLLMDNKLLLGINNFYDFTSLNDHYRTGLGLEAFTESFEFRANGYYRLSPKRFIGVTATERLYEQAANGLDVEVGGPIGFGWLEEFGKGMWAPDWIKLYGGYYWYDYRRSDDLEGLKFRVELKPVSGFVLNLSVFNDNNGPTLYQGDIRVNLQIKDFRPRNLLAAFTEAKTQASSNRSLDTRTLDRVERNFVIQVEHPPVKKQAPLVGRLANVQLVVRFPGENPVTTDNNGNGFVDPGEDFELDVLMTNSTSETSTGIRYENAVMSGDPNRIRINTEAYLPDAPPGGTTRTDNDTDMDPSFYVTDTPGTELFVTLDFTADGQTRTLTFGPFVVGAVHHDQVINVVAD